MSMQRTSHPSAALDFFYNAALSNTVVSIATVNGNLYGVLGENNSDTDDAYLQFFDKAATGDVTLGTTTPDWTLKLHNNTTIQIVFDRPIRYFALGCQVACTSTRTGSSAPAAAATVTCHFKQ